MRWQAWCFQTLWREMRWQAQRFRTLWREMCWQAQHFFFLTPFFRDKVSQSCFTGQLPGIGTVFILASLQMCKVQRQSPLTNQGWWGGRRLGSVGSGQRFQTLWREMRWQAQLLQTLWRNALTGTAVPNTLTRNALTGTAFPNTVMRNALTGTMFPNWTMNFRPTAGKLPVPLSKFFFRWLPRLSWQFCRVNRKPTLRTVLTNLSNICATSRPKFANSRMSSAKCRSTNIVWMSYEEKRNIVAECGTTKHFVTFFVQ